MAPRPKKSRFTRHSMQELIKAGNHQSLSHRSAAYSKLMRLRTRLRGLALLKYARSRASVGCGDRLNGVSAARQHLGIGATIELPLNAQLEP